MRALAAIARRTVRQTLGWKRLLLFAAMAVLPIAAFAAAATTFTAERMLAHILAAVTGVYLPLVVPIIVLIVAASALGGERRDATLGFLVLRPLPRAGIAGAKALGAVIAACLVVVPAGLLAAVVHLLLADDPRLLVAVPVAGAVATLAYAGPFLLLGFLTDRAVLVGLAYVLIVENGVISALPTLASLSPWRLGVAALAGLAPNVVPFLSDTALGSLRPGAWGAAGQAALITVVAVAAVTWLLRTRDLT